MPSPVPHLWIAAVIRPHHANTFVEELLRLLWASGAPGEAFSETHLIEWPDNEGRCGDEETPEERRYHEIEDEILKRMFEVMTPVITEAFVRVAPEVLDRERQRQRDV